jgi:N6-adenosine-specific RNA methylase IME4
VTNTYLLKGGWLLEALGFRYVNCVTWEKDTNRLGLGQYFRGQTEHMLFGVRGNGYAVRTGRKDVKGLLEVESFKAKVGRHSEKPEEAYELIESRSKGPYLEVFARSGREGWVSWGNEVA